MKANIVNDDEQLINPGDIMPYTNINGIIQLIMVCPGCGKQSASRGNHVFDPVTVSYTPSIVHDPKFGGCGWHGFLTNGKFTSC